MTASAATEATNKRRLAVDGGIQFLGRTFEADLRQIVTENVVGSVEDRLGRRRGGGQFAAHADSLRALARKEKCGDMVGSEH